MVDKCRSTERYLTRGRSGSFLEKLVPSTDFIGCVMLVRQKKRKGEKVFHVQKHK